MRYPLVLVISFLSSGCGHTLSHWTVLDNLNPVRLDSKSSRRVLFVNVLLIFRAALVVLDKDVLVLKPRTTSVGVHRLALQNHVVNLGPACAVVVLNLHHRTAKSTRSLSRLTGVLSEIGVYIINEGSHVLFFLV